MSKIKIPFPQKWAFDIKKIFFKKCRVCMKLFVKSWVTKNKYVSDLGRPLAVSVWFRNPVSKKSCSAFWYTTQNHTTHHRLMRLGDWYGQWWLISTSDIEILCMHIDSTTGILPSAVLPVKWVDDELHMQGQMSGVLEDASPEKSKCDFNIL